MNMNAHIQTLWLLDFLATEQYQGLLIDINLTHFYVWVRI